MRKSLFALVALSLLVLASSTTAFASSNGPSVDPDLPWMTPQEFKTFDLKKNTKPVMYLFSRPGCSACDALKSTLNPATPALRALTKMFAVVHVQSPDSLGDDVELRRKYASAEFEPHGNYVPRAMFGDPKTGKVRPEVSRPLPGSEKEYPHFVSTSSELESAMRHALVQILGNGKGGLKVGSAPGEPLKKVERRKKRQERKKQKKEKEKILSSSSSSSSSSGGGGSSASRAEM